MTVREMRASFFLSFHPWVAGWVSSVDAGKRGASENSRRQFWWVGGGRQRANSRYVSWRGTERGISGNCCFCDNSAGNMMICRVISGVAMFP
jgi:hypothetical protein